MKERRMQLSATKHKTVHSLELKQIEALGKPSQGDTREAGSEPFAEVHVWTGTVQDGTMRPRRVLKHPEKDGYMG
jgi:hypothetical protein